MQSTFADSTTLVIALVVFWFGGAALISRIAGWHMLSAQYRAPLHLHGEELRFCTVTVGPASLPITYRRCIRVALTDQGLGIGLMFPFSFHSPPFFAPWPSVVSCNEKQSLANRKVTLTFAGTGRQVAFAGELGQIVKATYCASAASPAGAASAA